MTPNQILTTMFSRDKRLGQRILLSEPDSNGQQWVTDSHWCSLAVYFQDVLEAQNITEPGSWRRDKTTEAFKLVSDAPKLDGLWPVDDGDLYRPVTVAGKQVLFRSGPLLLRAFESSEEGKVVAFDDKYLSGLESRIVGMDLHGVATPTKPAIIQADGKRVGLIMPVRIT